MPLISDSIGRVLGKRYRLVSALGTGASAHVFLAEDVSLQRRVAVKVLQPALVQDASFLKRFGAEARAVAQLNHPNILRVFDWGEDTDGPYLVLEYLHGGSLRDILDRDVRLSEAQTAHLGTEVAHGLAYAHARGLVHRDIKPANLLFDEEGRVRIADFGVARALAEAAWTEPAGAMVGTARYASPEQAEGRRVDGRADVYSLSLVLYECLTGDVPFVSDTTLGTLMARVGATLPQHPGLGRLDDVLARGAAPDAEARLTAATLAARLEAVGASLPPPAPLPLRVGGAEPSTPGGAGLPASDDVTAIVPNFGARPAETMVSAAVIASAATGEVFDAEATVAPAGQDPPPAPVIARRRRARWPWVLAAVVVVAAVAVGFIVASREKVFTPSTSVPSVTGKTPAAARQTLTARHLDMTTGPAVYSIHVPTGRVASQNPASDASLKQGSSVTVAVSEGPPSVSVPSLSGLGCPGATRILATEHLKSGCPQLVAFSPTVPTGQVINWSYNNQLDPKTAPYGATILVAISKGVAPVTIPSVVGDTSYAQAAATLQGAGLKSTQGTSTTSTSVPAGQVIGTTPAAGSAVAPGTTVTVTLSTGPPMITIPNITGDSVATATSALQTAGLALGQIYGPAGGTVFTTSPLAGQSVLQGSAVNLYTQ